MMNVVGSEHGGESIPLVENLKIVVFLVLQTNVPSIQTVEKVIVVLILVIV
jgi:hypothetical protein